MRHYLQNDASNHFTIANDAVNHSDVTIKDLPVGVHDYKSAVRKLLAFYEEVGNYLYYHREFKDRLISIVGDEPKEMWELLLPVVKNERRKFQEEKLYFYFEYLATEVKNRKA